MPNGQIPKLNYTFELDSCGSRCGPQKPDLHAVQVFSRLCPHDGMAHTALDIRTRSRHISLWNHDDLEVPIMMRNVSDSLRHLRQRTSRLLSLIVDAVLYLGLCLSPSAALAAENLFLRKQ